MNIKGIHEKPLFIEKSTAIACAPRSKAIIVDNSSKPSKIDVKADAEIVYVSFDKKMKKACIGKNAKLHLIELCSADATTETILAGKNAHATFLTLFIGKNAQLSFHNSVLHFAKETTSDITIFGTLEHSTCFSHATTTIKKQASGIAHQNIQTILLDKHSKASALPEMFISTSNVQATHYATASQIKPEILFYMMSRGLDEKTAQHAFVTGHFHALLNQYPKEIQQVLYTLIEKKIGENYGY